MSVSDRLARLLFIVPYVVDRDGVPLAELAEKLGVKARQIEADLGLLSMVGQPPLTPDHLIDIFVEDDIVYVELDQALTRPLRLTHDEARAIALAAKLVGDLGGMGDELTKTVDRILEHLNPVDADLVRSLSQRISVSNDDSGFHAAATLRDAIETKSEVEVDYYSVSSDAQKTYRLRPLAMISHTGIEYLAALDVGAQLQEKVFRTDRMAKVTRLEETFLPPEDLDLEKYRTPKLYFGASSRGAQVRFSPDVARRVQERFADERVELEPDGSVRVQLSTSSAAWLARWVLPFGVAAEVLAPDEQRAAVGRLCRDAARAYSR